MLVINIKSNFLKFEIFYYLCLLSLSRSILGTSNRRRSNVNSILMKGWPLNSHLTLGSLLSQLERSKVSNDGSPKSACHRGTSICYIHIKFFSFNELLLILLVLKVAMRCKRLIYGPLEWSFVCISWMVTGGRMGNERNNVIRSHRCNMHIRQIWWWHVIVVLLQAYKTLQS